MTHVLRRLAMGLLLLQVLIPESLHGERKKQKEFETFRDHKAPTPGRANTAPQLEQQLNQAHAALRRGDTAAMVAPLSSALRLARQAAPLEVSALTVLQTPPSGLGMYLEAPGSQVRGGTLLLYVEVRNFGLRDKLTGHEVHLTTDASFFYEDGELIARKQGIGVHRFETRTPHDVTFMVIELQTRGLPAQPYQIEISVTDRVSGKQGSARTRFTVAG